MASDGVITLTGFVDSYGQKFSAEHAVKRVRDVLGVANDIHVKVGDERSDSEIAKDAVHALQSHTNVPCAVKVTARDGFITLDGAVEWNHQRSAAESAGRHVKGVKGVSNAIGIGRVASAERPEVLTADVLKREGGQASVNQPALSPGVCAAPSTKG